MQEQVVQFGRDAVNLEIAKSINKCCQALDIILENHMLQMLVEDIVEKYSTDSVEDVQQCLKKGRRGNYGTTYNKMNMIVISDWMSKHLQEKAQAREKHLAKFKNGKVTFEDWKKLFDNAPKQSDVQQIAKPKAREYKPSASQLKYFANIIKTFTLEELQGALKNWKQMQKTQHVEIIQKEINSRKSK